MYIVFEWLDVVLFLLSAVVVIHLISLQRIYYICFCFLCLHNPSDILL
jgi:hypothetical protein